MALSREEELSFRNEINSLRQEASSILESAGLKEGPSAKDKLIYGFDKGVSSAQGLGMLARQGMMGTQELEEQQRLRKETLGGMDIPTVPHEGAVLDPDVTQQTQEAVSGAITQERERQLIEEEVNLSLEHPYIHNNPTYRDDLWVTLGEIGKEALLDVTMAIPFGTTVKGAMTAGAASLGLEQMIREQATKGDINPATVGAMALLGGVSAGFIHYGGEKVTKWLNTKAEARLPVTKEEVQELANEANIKIDKPESVADRINRVIINPEGYGEKSTKKSFREALKTDPELADHFEFIARNAEGIREAERALEKQKNIMDTEAYYAARDSIANMQKEQAFALRKAQTQVRSFTPVESSIMEARNSIHRDLNRKATLRATPEVAYREEMTAWDSMGNAERSKLLQDIDNAIPNTEAEWKSKLREEWNSTELTLSQLKTRDVGKLSRTAREAIREEEERLAKIKEEQIDFLWAKQNHEKEVLSHLRNPDVKNQAMADALEKAYHNKFKGQAGDISQQLLTSMAGGSVGGTVGYALGGEEGAAIGLALGAGTPWFAKGVAKMYNAMTHVAEGTSDAYTRTLGFGASRPDVVMQKFGPWGQTIAREIRTAFENVDLRIAGMTSELKKRLDRIPTVQRGDVSAVLQGVKSPTSQAMREVTDLIKKDFNNIVDETVKANIISKAAGDKMKAKAAKDGYWPRIYNEEYLSTKAGKEHFAQVLSDEKWKQDSLEATLGSILGENKQLVSDWMKIFSKQKQGDTWIIRRDQALRLLEARGKAKAMNRSSHLESKRKIHVRSEELLRPFLETDPEKVLTSYFYDSFRRIEFSKKFDGINEKGNFETDYIFNKMVSKMSADVMTNPKNKTDSLRAEEFARQLYYTAVGDSKSGIIKQQVNMMEGTKRFYGFTNALETLKLGMAQMVNLSQAMVNGSTLISSRLGSRIPGVGTAKGLSIAMKGIAKQFTSEGQEYSKLTGAAIESVLLETMGEIGVNHTLLGRPTWKMVDWINNPTSFLKATGFLFVERLQRNFAANMGKAFVESVLNDKAKIMKRLSSGKVVSPAKQKKLERINKLLDDFGIDSTLSDVTQIPEDQMLRAGLRFSNQVNFVNKADTIPLLWQYPHASVFRKFKTFMFHQTKFIKDEVIKPAVRDGNMNPMITYLGIMAPAMGIPISTLKDMIKGDDKDYTMTERWMKGMSAVGGLGIVWDSLQSAYYGPHHVFAAAGGPFVSDVGYVLHGTTRAFAELKESGDVGKAGTTLGVNTARILPPPISNWLKGELKEDNNFKRSRTGRNSRSGRPGR